MAQGVRQTDKSDESSYRWKSKRVRKAEPRSRLLAMSALAMSSLFTLTLSGCGQGGTAAPSTGYAGQSGVVRAVAAEDQYASVIRQIGGKYVSVSALMSNPNTDPHTYEASTADASLISQAQVVVQNGLGYDDFMNKLEAASPNRHRKVIDVAQSLGYGPDTRNPHLWYNPTTMSRLAVLVEQSLAQADPARTADFQQNLQKFQASMKVLDQTIVSLKRTDGKTPVAVTEPVADYLLQAAGLEIRTPWTFQAAVMNGIDPSPQDVQTVENMIAEHQVDVLVYNEQAVSTVTSALLTEARANHIPVVGVYETMPPNDTYQSWMTSEVRDLSVAIGHSKARQQSGG